MTSSSRPSPRAFHAGPLAAGERAFRPAHAPEAAAPAAPPAADPDALLREAFERGVEAGRASLPWEEAEQLKSAVAALQAAAQSLRDEAGALRRASREALLELALAIAGRLLEREVAADLDALTPLLDRALAELGDLAPISVTLSPRDLATLTAGGAPAIAELLRSREAELAADLELCPGDARVAVGAACVDLRRASLLERFRRELAELVGVAEGTP